MKKFTSVLLAVIMILFAFTTVNAAQTSSNGQGAVGFATQKALYAHAVSGSDDVQAWQMWQCEHDEDMNEVNSNVKYFFLPSSVKDSKVDIYNAYSQSVTIGSTTIAPSATINFEFKTNTSYEVSCESGKYTLYFYKSSAEAAVYVNNTDADGSGTDLVSYLNANKNNSAKASGAIVDSNGSIDNTAVKKIKGRGNTTWYKPKKPYNITYSDNVSIAGMESGKKFSLLANYQDDALSRNRILYDLSDAVNMPYASDSRFVDLYANGYYWGSYQITQKIDTGKSTLISDFSADDYLDADKNVKADFPFLCEVDAGATDGVDYYVKTESGNKITIKSPELSEGDTGYEEVKQYVKEKYDALFKAIKSKSSNLSQLADVDSLTKIYFINELGKNWDAGVSSLYFTYKQDSDGNYKFYASPVWDYDNSLGNAAGSSGELRYSGVTDYTLYSGWWCKYKGKASNEKSSSNIMNNIARNTTVLNAAPKIWFEEFVPALNTFMSTGSDSTQLYSSDVYYSHLNGSAEMNYKSGWLLNTGEWIADHSSMQKASFDISTGKYTVSSTATTYTQDFTGMFNYCSDWMLSRAAWLSSQMYSSYTPPTPEYIKGDVDGSGKVEISDATLIQKYSAHKLTLTSAQFTAGDVTNDGQTDVSDVTMIQKFIAKKITSFN